MKVDRFLCLSCVIVIALLVVDISIALFGSSKMTANDVFNKNILSVVEIKAETDSVGESFGTGEFVSANGTIVTNAHVVTYSVLGEATAFQNYYIRFADSNDYIAVELVKFDSQLDIAVLKYTSKNLHKFNAVELGNSKAIGSGDEVFAIGNAMNYGLTISSGIVGIPLINITHDGNTRKVIQCDLTISEGNSGGALFNNAGKLIGITTFRTKDNSGNVVYGIAYCIPINVVMDYVNGK